ncbi:MAG: ROK family protein [Nakamurella sp.]
MTTKSAERGGSTPSALLGVLASRGPASRAELARTLDVSSATVTQLTKDLLRAGSIQELDTVPSDGGRPARLLGLVHSPGNAIGVKVTADHVALVEVNADLAIERSTRLPYDPTRADAVDQLVRLVEGEVAGVEHLLGVGVGVPGSVDAQDSGVVDAHTLGWSGATLGAQLRARLQVPVLVDNDVNTLAVADRLFGVGRDHRDYLIVTVGRGIGLAMIVDGNVYRGSSGGVGEIGHICVVPDGPVCSCGLHGCLEAVIGDQALIDAGVAQGILSAGSEPAALRRAADEGSTAAQQIYSSAGDVLGRTLAGIVHLVNPETVVILGEGVAGWAHWADGFADSFRRHLIPSRRHVGFQTVDWDEDTWALGAASLILASPFDALGVAGTQGKLVRERLHAHASRSSG